MSPTIESPFRIVKTADQNEWISAPKIASLLMKPASALCNLDCEHCFYLDREADPYEPSRRRIMTCETLARLIEGFLAYSFPHASFAFRGGEPALAGLGFFESLIEFQRRFGRRGQVVPTRSRPMGSFYRRIGVRSSASIAFWWAFRSTVPSTFTMHTASIKQEMVLGTRWWRLSDCSSGNTSNSMFWRS